MVSGRCRVEHVLELVDGLWAEILLTTLGAGLNRDIGHCRELALDFLNVHWCRVADMGATD